jgi:uncharacterized protein YfkK (UPF0435 family)
MDEKEIYILNDLYDSIKQKRGRLDNGVENLEKQIIEIREQIKILSSSIHLPTDTQIDIINMLTPMLKILENNYKRAKDQEYLYQLKK